MIGISKTMIILHTYFFSNTMYICLYTYTKKKVKRFQVYTYKVVKLAPSSQFASKRGLATFNSFIFIIFTKWQNQAILAYRFKIWHNIFFCRDFSVSVRIFSAAVKSGQDLHYFWIKWTPWYGEYFYTLFDLNRYHNKMAPLRFAITLPLSIIMYIEFRPF